MIAQIYYCMDCQQEIARIGNISGAEVQVDVEDHIFDYPDHKIQLLIVKQQTPE